MEESPSALLGGYLQYIISAKTMQKLTLWISIAAFIISVAALVITLIKL
nr:MAG TPA: Putative Holin-like Toxin (Hol-Tox) [Caudoviricetes sp.]